MLKHASAMFGRVSSAACRAIGIPAWPLLLAIILPVAGVAWQAARDLTADYDLTVPEGSIIYSVRALAGGDGLYRDFSRPPYATTPYGPLLYLGTAAIAWPAGGGIETTYFCGRLLVLCATLVGLVFVSLIAREAGASRPCAVASACLAATVPYLIPWGWTCRPDLPAIAFSLAGVWVIGCGRGAADATLAASLFVLAFFTKSSALAGPCAAGLFLLGRRAWLPLLVMTGAWFAGVVAGIVLLQWATSRLFLLNVLTGNAAPIIGLQPIEFLGNFGIWRVAVPGVLALIGVWGRRRFSAPEGLLLLYAGIAYAIATMTSLKSGADCNYFLEPAFALSSLAGPGLGRLGAATRRSPRLRSAVAAVAVLLAAWGMIVISARWRYTEPRYSDWHPLWARLGQVDGGVLFSDAGLAVRSRRKVWLLDKFNAAYLEEAGVIRLEQLVEALEARRIGAVVLDGQTLTSEVRGQAWWPRSVAIAIDRNYEFAEVIGDQGLYLPKRRTAGENEPPGAAARRAAGP